MSGCGRKHRAKHLTRQYLDVSAWQGPLEGQSLGVCMESPHGQHLRVLLLHALEGDHNNISEPEETIVFLPGKFQKVIWLSIKDVVVIVDHGVHLKPSPEQLANFLKDPENTAWRRQILKSQALAEAHRPEMERMPQYGSTAVTTTSVLRVDPAHSARAAQVARADELAEERDMDEEEEDDLENVVNPNWGTIKHRQQYFCGVDDEEEEEEEEDDD